MLRGSSRRSSRLSVLLGFACTLLAASACSSGERTETTEGASVRRLTLQPTLPAASARQARHIGRLEIPEQPTGQEIAWFQAYVKGCRGWLNPQEMLPKLVDGE